jgi:RNA polymerase sigma factor (sigma-70 family)
VKRKNGKKNGKAASVCGGGLGVHLSRDELASLIKTIQDDQAPVGAKRDAESAAAREYEWFIVWTARPFRGKGLEKEELHQHARMGFLHALTKYDWRRGELTTYSRNWIICYVKKAIAEESPAHSGLSVKNWEFRKAGLVRKAVARLEALGVFRPSASSILEVIRSGKGVLNEAMTLKDVERCLRTTGRRLSLDDPAGSRQEGRMTLLDLQPCDRIPSPENLYALTEKIECIRRRISGLAAGDRRILEMVFGLNGESRHTNVETGRKFGVSRERIRQIVEKALGRIQITAVELKYMIEASEIAAAHGVHGDNALL